MSELVPNLSTPSMTRWSTSEAVVVADTSREHPGVYLHLRTADQRRIDDPARLIAMLTAAEKVMVEHRKAKSLSKDAEIAFRKDWDARVVPSPGTGGIRHPGNGPGIVGTRPRAEASP